MATIAKITTQSHAAGIDNKTNKLQYKNTEIMMHDSLTGIIEPIIQIHESEDSSSSIITGTIGTDPIYLSLNTCVTDDKELYDEYYMDVWVQIKYLSNDENHGFLIIYEIPDINEIDTKIEYMRVPIAFNATQKLIHLDTIRVPHDDSFDERVFLLKAYTANGYGSRQNTIIIFNKGGEVTCQKQPENTL